MLLESFLLNFNDNNYKIILKNLYANMQVHDDKKWNNEWAHLETQKQRTLDKLK